MGIYVKTSSGAECLHPSFNLVKTAMYNNSGDYNFKTITTNGTAWDNAVWDDIGLTYVVDTSHSRNYFIVPSSGIVIIQCSIAISSASPSSLIKVGANLHKNDILQYSIKSRIAQDFYANFTWFQKVNKGDKLAITFIHLYENPIVCLGKSSRLNFVLVF